MSVRRLSAIALAVAATGLTPSAHAEADARPATSAPTLQASAPPVPSAPAVQATAPAVPSAPSVQASAPAPAPESPPPSTPLVLRPSKPIELAHEPPSSSIGWKLMAFIAVIGGAAYYSRRKFASKPVTDAQLTIVRRTAVGYRTELLVVNVEGQRLLLGVTPQSIQSLAILDSDDSALESPAPIVAEASVPTASSSLSERFAAMLDAADRPAPRAKSSILDAALRPAPRAKSSILDAALRPAPRAKSTRREPQAKVAQPEANLPEDDGSDIESQARGLLALRRPR